MMKVLCFGTYERLFPRNTTLISGLRRAGVEVIECHEPLWELTRDKSGTSFTNPLSLLKTGLRVLYAYARLICRHGKLDYDLMVVGYMGYLDMLVAAPLARWRKRPLIYSPVVSLHETVVSDRKMFRPGSIAARLAWWLDSLSLKLATCILLETDTYISYFSEEFVVPQQRFFRVLLGADEDNFIPSRTPAPRDSADPLRVFFYGKFTPLQGVPIIVRAAALLEKRCGGIRFQIVGSGQLSQEVHNLATDLQVGNIEFIDWEDYHKLPKRIAEADVCLGIFGETEKTQRGIPVKVFDALAMGQPIITGDTPAARELFTHDVNALLCPTGDPEALALQIERLNGNRELLAQLATASRETFNTRCTQEIIGTELLAHFKEWLDSWKNGRGLYRTSQPSICCGGRDARVYCVALAQGLRYDDFVALPARNL